MLAVKFTSAKINKIKAGEKMEDAQLTDAYFDQLNEYLYKSTAKCPFSCSNCEHWLIMYR